MSLAPGARLGPYEILAPLGAGGMGEVYRARDPRIGRDVAIKVLPETLAQDSERLARFKREAHVLGSLNHPHIAAIYGVEESAGVIALVLELVEGVTLAERIEQGPIPLDEALSIARGVADALEAAHEQNVVHRDLKPANIKLRADGTVKVLDFGLAKVADTGGARVEPHHSMSPTMTSPAVTMGGIILGTAAYMSPEQARGKPVDKRTDIWAFGCVLYEMLAGKRAFDGDEVTDTLAAIIRAEPDWRALPGETPPSIRRLLRRALEKNQKDRLADVADARLELRDATERGETATLTSTRTFRRERLAWLGAVSLLTVGLIATAMLYVGRPTESAVSYQAAILSPVGTTFGGRGSTPAGFMALSPDGRRLAFVASDESRRPMLWVRSLDAPDARPLPGTEGAREPFWSHDSRSVAFIADGRLKRIDAGGGSVQTITEPAVQAGSWNKDDVILFVPTNASPLHRVSASGGASTPVTVLDRANGERTHRYPVFFPDGNHFMYIGVGSKAGPNHAHGVFVASLDQPTTIKRLLDDGSTMQYSAGHLLYLRDNTLLARRFAVDRLEWTGEATPIAEQIATGGGTGRGALSAALDGTLVFQTASSGGVSQLQWFDRTGKPLGVVGQAGDYSDVELSPDGKSAAMAVLDPQRRTRDIWLVDLIRNLPQKATTSPLDEFRPVWSPDGKSLAFCRIGEASEPDMYLESIDGIAPEALAYKGGIPLSWSSDGRHILFSLRTVTAGSERIQSDIWVFSVSDRKARPYIATPFHENTAAFSPDGKWVAYSSDETGSPEVYVAAFPEPTGKKRVSPNGGIAARWRRAAEILYGAPGGAVMAAAVAVKGSELVVAGTQRLFEARVRGFGLPGDVTADGQQILLNTVVEDSFANPLTLVVNWPELLKKTGR